MNTSTPSTSASSRKYTRRSEAQWRELITSFDQSDLTLEAFCQHHKIAPSGFYTWRKRFQGESDQDASSSALIDITSSLSSQPSAAPNDSSWQVELELGHGCVLRIKTA